VNIRFEKLKEVHLPDVKKIYDWYIAHSTATFHTEPVTLDELKDFIHIDHALYVSYIIYAGEKMVGYCFLTNHKKRQAYNRTAEITIYLDPDFRQKGIGKVAIHHLEQRAKQNGLKNLIAVITGDNTGSIALFERSGFVKCAHYKNIGEKFNKVLDVVALQKEI
jgi:L-amino acid N-acyltransferase YncA